MRGRERVDEKMYINTPILYKSENLLLISVRKNLTTLEKKAFIICEGLSLSIDEYKVPSKWDLNMTIPTCKSYSMLEGDVITGYFPFECKSLDDNGRELAEYINYDMKQYKNIVIIGHYIAGLSIANMAKWINRSTKMVFVSTPFLGTIMADDNAIRKKMNLLEYKRWGHFAQHTIDKDVKPDSQFIQERADFSGTEDHICYNVVSQISTLRSIMDFEGRYLNMRLGYEKGDGIVDISSQEYLSRLYPHIPTSYIDASNFNSLSRFLKKEYKHIII